MWKVSVRRVAGMLGWLFVPLMALVLVTSEVQDRALRGQQDATEFFAWVAGMPIERNGVVLSYPKPGCMLLKLDDPFPLGTHPIFCSDRLPLGTKFRVGIKGHAIFYLELLER